MTAPYTVDQVADALIHLSREQGIEITNLKLQKLLYYAQAWYLANTNEPLFDADFEAWVHGPVVPRIFRRFREYRWNPITEPIDPPKDAPLRGYVEEVLGIYGGFSATQLERLTHQEDPWRNARQGRARDESSSEVISKESIKKYYQELGARQA